MRGDQERCGDCGAPRIVSADPDEPIQRRESRDDQIHAPADALERPPEDDEENGGHQVPQRGAHLMGLPSPQRQGDKQQRRPDDPRAHRQIAHPRRAQDRRRDAAFTNLVDRPGPPRAERLRSRVRTDRQLQQDDIKGNPSEVAGGPPDDESKDAAGALGQPPCGATGRQPRPGERHQPGAVESRTQTGQCASSFEACATVPQPPHQQWEHGDVQREVAKLPPAEVQKRRRREQRQAEITQHEWGP